MEFYEKFKYPIIGGLVGANYCHIAHGFWFIQNATSNYFHYFRNIWWPVCQKTGIIDQFLNRK